MEPMLTMPSQGNWPGTQLTGSQPYRYQEGHFLTGQETQEIFRTSRRPSRRNFGTSKFTQIYRYSGRNLPDTVSWASFPSLGKANNRGFSKSNLTFNSKTSRQKLNLWLRQLFNTQDLQSIFKEACMVNYTLAAPM